MDELDNKLKNMAMLPENVEEVGYAQAPKMQYILNWITKWKWSYDVEILLRVCKPAKNMEAKENKKRRIQWYHPNKLELCEERNIGRVNREIFAEVWLVSLEPLTNPTTGCHRLYSL